MDKTVSIVLGGKERVLLLGKLGFFYYIKECTGEDPIDWLNNINKDDNTIKKIDGVAIIIYAGLNTQLDSEDGENISFQKAKKWANALDVKDMQMICNVAFGSFSENGVEKNVVTQAVKD